MQTLYPHQEQAVVKILDAQDAGSKAFLLADEVGLGKTRAACETIYRMKSEYPGPALVVAPLSTFTGWQSEAKQVGLRTAIVRSGEPMPQRVDLIITNYECLQRIPEIVSRAPGSKFWSCAKRWPVIVWDEAHKLKAQNTIRNKIWRALSGATPFNLYLTATPGQSPLDLGYLSDVIGFGSSFWSWVTTFRGIWRPKWGGFKWSPRIEDTRRMEGMLGNGTKSLRRKPQDIVGWPELNRIVYPIRLTDRERAAYQRAIADYLSARAEAGKDAVSAEVLKLVAIGQLRQRISFLKASYTAELAREHLEAGKAVTIGVEFLDSIPEIMKELFDCRILVLEGSIGPEERKAMLEAWSKDEADVFIFTGTEGINLHKQKEGGRERIQIDHDIRWSGLAQHQLDGRTHRAGEYAPVYWMTAENTVDDRVAKAMKSRLDTMTILTNVKIEIDDLFSVVS